MLLRTVVSALVVLLLASCGADEVVDQAGEQVSEAADDVVASQLADQLAARTQLSQAQADCVAAEVVADLGASTVVRLVIETGGDLSQVSAEDRQRVETSARAAADTCGIGGASLF